MEKKRKNEATTLLEMRDMWLKRKESIETSVKGRLSILESLLTGKDRDTLGSLINDLKDLSDEKCETRIPLERITDVFEFGNFSIIKCTDCFVWKSFNYRAIVYPSYNFDMSNGGGALYGTIEELCLLAEKDRKHLLTEDEKEEKNMLLMLVTFAFTLPVMMFNDSAFAVDVYLYAMNKWTKSLEKASERLNPETPEDAAKNQFMNEMIKEDAEFKEEQKEGEADTTEKD